MILTLVVEMTLFLIGAVRVDEKVHKRETQKMGRGVADRTKLQNAYQEERAVRSAGSTSQKKRI